MACRVGTSKDPQERIKYWKQKEGHTIGFVIASGLTYNEAQQRERQEAQQRRCFHAPGGDPGMDRYNRVWSVYYVGGGRVPR